MADITEEYVMIDALALDPLILSFAPAAKKTLLYSFIEISENIDDDFHRTAVKDLLDASDVDLQEVFQEIEAVLPHYVPLLLESFREHGDEMYMEEDEVIEYLGKMPEDAGFKPKLIIRDEGQGEGRGYALLQVAARKAGVKDDNLRMWYVYLAMFMGSSLPDEITGQHRVLH